MQVRIGVDEAVSPFPSFIRWINGKSRCTIWLQLTGLIFVLTELPERWVVTCAHSHRDSSSHGHGLLQFGYIECLCNLLQFVHLILLLRSLLLYGINKIVRPHQKLLSKVWVRIGKLLLFLDRDLKLRSFNNFCYP